MAPFEARQQINAAQYRPGNAYGRHDPRGCGQVGVDQHIAHGHRIDRAAECELRAAIESKPAEPQDEYPQRHEGNIGWHGGPRGAVGTELAEARAQHQSAGKRRPATGGMHDGGPGEILKSHLVEPAAAPGPGTDQWVDQSGQYHREQEEGP